MDTLFYILSLFSFSLGLFNLGGLFFLKNQLNDRGTWTLALPLIPLLLITALLIIQFYLEYRYPGKIFTYIIILLEWARIAVAFSWNFVTYYHYSLNGIELIKSKTIYFLAGISILLCTLTVLFLFILPTYMPVIHISVIILFYHAGIRAVLILRKKKNLLPSTRTGLAVAVFSLVTYPVIGIGAPLGWKIPFLNPDLSLWVQSHPVYFIFVNIIFTSFVLQSFRNTKAVYPIPEQNLQLIKSRLSSREIEVFNLLIKGLSYKQIAVTLFISLPTVKSHIQHIYTKLEVKRREELFIKCSKDYRG